MSQLCRSILGDETDLISRRFFIKLLKDMKWSKKEKEQNRTKCIVRHGFLVKLTLGRIKGVDATLPSHQLLSTIKVKLVDKMKQSKLFMLFYMSSTKNYQL